MVIFQYNVYLFGSIFEPCYIQNRVITNCVIKRLLYSAYIIKCSGSLGILGSYILCENEIPPTVASAREGNCIFHYSS